MSASKRFMLFRGKEPIAENFVARVSDSRYSSIISNGFPKGYSIFRAATPFESAIPAAYFVEHVCGSGRRNLLAVTRGYEEVQDLLDRNELLLDKEGEEISPASLDWGILSRIDLGNQHES